MNSIEIGLLFPRKQRPKTAIIPNNGAVEGVIDLSSLIEKVQKHDNLDVLNGIAYNNVTKTLFVTGKMWNKIFEIEIFKK